MALTYRTTAYGGGNVPLTNAQVDENFSWLDANKNYFRIKGDTSGSLVSGDVNLLAGTNVTIAQVGNNITINANDTSVAWTELTGVPTTFAPSAHVHAATDITSGTMATARLGSGTASATTYLRGDSTWSTFSNATVGLGNVENTALSTWAGSANVTTLGTIATGTWNAVAISAIKGGTGLTSYSTGDIIYSSSANTLSKLSIGTAGQVIKSILGVPAWSSLSSSDITTALGFTPVQQGTGTGQLSNVVKIGWNNSNLLLQIDAINFGASWPISVTGNAATVTSVIASQITSGTLATARLGSGTASSNTYLRGDSTWAVLDALPSQTGNVGKYLTTNGSTTSWSTVAEGASLSDSTTTDAPFSIPFSDLTSGTFSTAYINSSSLYFNPSSGTLNSISFNSLSDVRFKTDLVQITQALDKLEQLTGYTFSMIESNTRSSGLIAQDLQKVLPESVGGNEDKLTVNYGAVMGLIVEAIKELNSKVDAIQNQLLINK